MLDVVNLACRFDGKEILKDISFRLNEGDSLGVVGPNGAGKTTLLRLISGLISPREGKVLIEGEDVKLLDRHAISRKIAMVPQNTYINFPFTSFEVVLMGRHPYLGRFERESSKDLEKVRECMHLTKTWHLKDREVTQISGGELQRVIIAQSLVQDTPILLLDEPTSHLDINNEFEILDIISRMNKERKKSIILVSHDLNLAARYCERLILLKEGRIFAQGEVERVLTPENIRSVYHLSALVKKHPLTGFIYTLPISLQKEDRGRVRGRVHFIGGGGSTSRMMKQLFDRGYNVSVGVVNVFDADFETARVLEVPCVAEAPFSPITDESYRMNMQLISEAQLLVLGDVPFGKGNILNLKAAREAAEKGIKVVVCNSTPIEKKDYTGGEATEIFRNILARGASIVEDEDKIIDYVLKRFS